jgi:citrate lyase subunit beta/citryl-CoA lyase
VGADVDGIAVTKVESADHVKRIDEHILALESTRGMRHGHTRLIAMIESPGAFFQMPAIAAASSRLAAMNIGGEDFALETGMEPSEATLLMPKQQMIFAARAAGIMPLGFIDSLASFADLDAFAAMVQRSRQFGLHGRGLYPSEPGAHRQPLLLALGGGRRVCDTHCRRRCDPRRCGSRLMVARRPR